MVCPDYVLSRPNLQHRPRPPCYTASVYNESHPRPFIQSLMGQLVLLTPSKSSHPRPLLSRQHFTSLSPLATTLMDLPASVGNKRLTVWLSPLAATYKKQGGGARGSIAQIEKLPHFAELLVARLEQFPDRLIRQRCQLPVQHFVQEPRRRFVVGVRASF